MDSSLSRLAIASMWIPRSSGKNKEKKAIQGSIIHQVFLKLIIPYFSYPYKCIHIELYQIMHPICGLHQLHFIAYHVVEADCSPGASYG